MTWHLIKTKPVPKNTLVVLYLPNSKIHKMIIAMNKFYPEYPDYDHWLCCAGNAVPCGATHWMPIPEPPKLP